MSKVRQQGTGPFRLLVVFRWFTSTHFPFACAETATWLDEQLVPPQYSLGREYRQVLEAVFR